MKVPVLIFAATALVGTAVCPVFAGPSDYAPVADQSAPDNSAQNARDRGGKTMTPMDQSNDPADIDLTKRVRQAVENTSGLSTDAKNVKIITVEKVVWLRGPVASTEEKTVIVKTAKRIAGKRNVRDQLEVAPKS